MANDKLLMGWFAVVAAYGCAKEDAIPIEKTATDFAQAICPKAYGCCTADQLKNNMAAGATELECEANTAQNFRNQLQVMQAAEAAGRARYDQAQVDGCLYAIRRATCSTLTMISRVSGLSECDSTFATPLVAVGGACQNDFECIDSVCVKASGASQGTCGDGVPAGASCVADHCGKDLLCDPRDGSNADDDVCVVEQDNGASCTDNFECKSRVCAAPAAGGNKTCTSPSAAVCFYGGGCSVGHGRPAGATLLAIVALALLRRFRPRRA